MGMIGRTAHKLMADRARPRPHGRDGMHLLMLTSLEIDPAVTAVSV